MTLYGQLQEREKSGQLIRVGVIGAGQMGAGMVAQIATIPGMAVVGISDLRKENARKAADSYNESAKVKEDILISDDFKEVIHSSEVEVIVDATGSTEVGAKIAFETLLARKHLVLLNAEVDITIGPLMHQLFTATNLVYTGSDGDEPAATTELFEFAKSMGMEVLVAGKGKNNKLRPEANPDTVGKEAEERGMSAHMLASFADGTKTMAEMNLLSNAIGFLPDTVGMHGISADLEGTVKNLRTKEEGGVLDNYGVVEYVDGIAPGVFVIVKAQNEDVRVELDYMMKKVDDHHILYRPYHLASLETPLTVAKAVLNKDHAIVPLGTPVADTAAVTKKDIKAGEKIDGIGGYCVRGVIEKHEDLKANGHIPIGLIAGNVTAKRDIPKGTFLTEDDVELDTSTTVWKLRQLQDQMIG
ncbi:NAD(P)H-dependent oxidoreductase [Marinilactibacillus psychrotolerans]|uniref:NAD(P)H-dependent oxidoreductase n=1 Tax=Marinilactibacillus psychrotolerans TaxID=191770 RepID=A0ABW8ULJ3_9LACT